MICAASASTFTSENLYLVLGGEGGSHRTPSLAAADGAVGGVVEVAADVADLSVEEALAGKVFAVEVLCAPEAARGDGAALGAVGDGRSGGGGVRGDGEAGGGCEGAEEAGEEGREVAGHGCDGECDEHWEEEELAVRKGEDVLIDGGCDLE